LLVVGVPVRTGLRVIWLTGWWRILGVMALLIGAKAYRVYTAVQFAG
jgi:hypothetical protein